MKEISTRALIAIFVGVICLHLQVFSVGGYPVTLAALSVPVILAARLKSGPPSWQLLVLCSLILVKSLQALLDQDANDIEFLRTLALVCIAIWIVGCCSGGDLRRVKVEPRLYLAIICVIGSLSWLQWVSGELGSLMFFNPWRSFQYLHQYDPHLGLVPVRASAFYLEPSFAALVLITCTLCAIFCGARPINAVILAGLGLVPIKSASGILSLAVVLVICTVGNRLYGRERRGERWKLLTALLVVGFFFLPYLSTRLESTTQLGSSANYRLAAPVTVVKDAMREHLVGAPLGSVNDVVASAGLSNGSEAGSTLDNGIYVFLYYFGWAGLVLLVATAVTSVARIAQRENILDRDLLLITAGILLSSVFTGAVFTPEFALLAGLAIIEYRCARNRLSSCGASPDTGSLSSLDMQSEAMNGR